ncbi:hypothetical protein [Paenibacillus lautus]|jgi:hypothetical protein|uniref:hypothetical protein n=1 Tax=Paenibacillus lautus TaxID=1401 RepID=UPI001C12472D|nr:hypothetical protein [Paenibacillus lautus]MBU5345201.1 hypothetical protein [Paenibacillus lautus]
MREVRPLGRRFFWVKSTGNIVAQRFEMSAGIESTKEEDFEVYRELKSYDPEAIEMTTFEPGQYAEDFAQAKSWMFDPETGKILFVYPDPTDPETPQEPQQPLTDQVTALKTENESLKSRVSDVEMTITEILFS